MAGDLRSDALGIMFPAVRAVREDMCDFPTAWAIQRHRGTSLAHHPQCSSVLGLLCDCGAVIDEWRRMVAKQAAGRAALAEAEGKGGGNG